MGCRIGWWNGKCAKNPIRIRAVEHSLGALGAAPGSRREATRLPRPFAATRPGCRRRGRLPRW
jgi:hypothetical protein